MNDFMDWLNSQLNQTGWGYNELARRAGVSGSTISHIMSGRNKPGFEFCAQIARALNLSEDFVFRKAGLLPPLPPETAIAQEAHRLVRLIPPDRQQLALEILRLFAKSS